MSVPRLHQRRPDWRNSKCGREGSESALIGSDWQRLPSPFLPGMASGRSMKQVPQGQVPRSQTSGAKTQPSLIRAHTFLCVLWHRSREGELLCGVFVWSFPVDYVNLWLMPRTVHAWGCFFPIGRLCFIFAGRRIFQVSRQWYLQVPPGNSVTRPAKMTADELVFFVNGKKVSRSCLLVWSSCCLGRTWVISPTWSLWFDLVSFYALKGIAVVQELQSKKNTGKTLRGQRREGEGGQQGVHNMVVNTLI